MNKKQLIDCDDNLCERILGAAIMVHRELGPGLLESVYEKALTIELQDLGIKAEVQVEVPAVYKGYDLGLAFRADVVVERRLLLELKAVQELTELHLAQIMSYMRLLGFKRGYLLNFNAR